jgi:hypothetical protein
MTSMLRTFAEPKLGLTRFLKPESPCYDNGNSVVLFPFTYRNGVLDITYTGNNFQDVMVDVSGVSPDSETDTAIQILSGPYLVTSLGDNFKDYIRAWRDGTIDAGSPINVFIAPQILKVQEADTDHVNSTQGDSWLRSTIPPTSDGYVVGTVENKYQTSYVFKTPLTFTIVESGVTQYFTFRTKFDQE